MKLGGGRLIDGRSLPEHIGTKLVPGDSAAGGLLDGKAVDCGYPVLPQPASDGLWLLPADTRELGLGGWGQVVDCTPEGLVHGS